MDFNFFANFWRYSNFKIFLHSGMDRYNVEIFVRVVRYNVEIFVRVVGYNVEIFVRVSWDTTWKTSTCSGIQCRKLFVLYCKTDNISFFLSNFEILRKFRKKLNKKYKNHFVALKVQIDEKEKKEERNLMVMPL